jgi:hypothetical protein
MESPPKREGACSTHAPDSQKLQLPQSNSRSGTAQHVCAYSNTVAVREPPGGAAMSGETSRGGAAVETRSTVEGGTKKGPFRILPKEFRHDGFAYRQIAREGDIAIYEQRWNGCAEPSICYELVRVRYRDGFHIGSRFVEPAEAYSNSEAWGANGFTFTDRDAAFAKLRELA